MPRARWLSGKLAASSRPIPASSAAAAPASTAGRMRPISSMSSPRRSWRSISAATRGAVASGTNTSIGKPRKCPRKPGSATPTSVNGKPDTRSVEPIRSSRPPKRWSHSAWLITAAGADPGVSSAAFSSRPRLGRVPSSWKKPPDTSWPATSEEPCASPIAKPRPTKASTERDRARSRSSRNIGCEKPVNPSRTPSRVW